MNKLNFALMGHKAVTTLLAAVIIPSSPIEVKYEEPEEDQKPFEDVNVVYDADLGVNVAMVEELVLDEPVPTYDVNPYKMALDQNDLVMCAAVVEAEAGNQDLYGKRLVVDVILNRMRSPLFPNTLSGVVTQNKQFTVMRNGSYQKALGRISAESYQAIFIECENQIDYGILYFSRGKKNGKGHFKYQDHWFGY